MIWDEIWQWSKISSEVLKLLKWIHSFSTVYIIIVFWDIICLTFSFRKKSLLQLVTPLHTNTIFRYIFRYGNHISKNGFVNVWKLLHPLFKVSRSNLRSVNVFMLTLEITFNVKHQTPEIEKHDLNVNTKQTWICKISLKHYYYTHNKEFIMQIFSALCDISVRVGNPLSTNAKWFWEDIINVVSHSFFSFYYLP